MAEGGSVDDADFAEIWNMINSAGINEALSYIISSSIIIPKAWRGIVQKMLLVNSCLFEVFNPSNVEAFTS